jgi:uncharacterized protein (DUF736 family)
MIVRESEEIVSNYIIVGGGWTGRSSTGDLFIRIKFKNSIPEGTSCTMWENKHKDTPKHPDYLVMAAVKEDEKPQIKEKLF